MFRTNALIMALVLAAALTAEARDMLPGPVSATLIDVKDGDTVRARAAIWLDQEVEINVRIDGIDTPERGGRAKCDEERQLAEEATEFLAGFLEGGTVTLRNIQYGKYAGRVLADLANGVGHDAAAALIEEGYARAYDGGKRKGWCE